MHTHAYAHTFTCTHTHIHTHTHTHMHVCIHARTHACKHASTHARTHASTHTRTQLQLQHPTPVDGSTYTSNEYIMKLLLLFRMNFLYFPINKIYNTMTEICLKMKSHICCNNDIKANTKYLNG